jgi:hypothetical protein
VKPPITPDGRYIVVDGRLWRAANPHLPPEVRQALVNRLMDARRAVKAALASGDAEQLAGARAQVQASKEALGERGAPWWTDGAPDLGRRPIAATPYAEWWQAAEKSDEAHAARAETPLQQ